MTKSGVRVDEFDVPIKMYTCGYIIYIYIYDQI